MSTQREKITVQCDCRGTTDCCCCDGYGCEQCGDTGNCPRCSKNV